MFRIIVTTITIGISWFSFSQSGCTDPQAQNYDPIALSNDGSCIYGTSNYTPTLISDLSDVLTENSGLTFFNNSIYNINDGGNSTFLNELAQDGSILRNIYLDSMQNVDWEGITQSETEFFIGDFGNNAGSRTNLKVYRINKDEVLQNDTVSSSCIQFYYPDQTNFVNQSNNHNFDCEAMIFYHDSIHLFTKGWANLYTKHYIIPLNGGDSVAAIFSDSLFVDGLITDASIDSQTGKLVLLGYKNNGSNFYTSFVYLLFDYPNNQFFKGNKRRIEIGNMLTLSQTEGITWKDQNSGYISSEKITSSFLTIPPKLFGFDFTTYFENDTLSSAAIDDLEMMIYPNPINDILNIEIDSSRFNDDYRIRVINNVGQVVLMSSLLTSKSSFEFGKNHDKGLYFLQLNDAQNHTIYIQKFILN
jgi:hypothetical protein